jgi:hypothetical protein
MAEKMCAAEAALLNSGMSKKAVCVDSIVCPFGNLNANGLLFIFVFKLGAFDNKKCPVQPESRRAVSLFLRRGGVLHQSSNVLLLFLDIAPKSQPLLTWDPPVFFCLGGFTLVSLFWVHASLACVVTRYFVTVGPAIVIRRRREIAVRWPFRVPTVGTFRSFFFEQCLDFLQCFCIVFQLFGQPGVVFTKFCYYSSVYSCGSC